ncbi:hypothetical protein R3P38DRAFT_619556 [Favolaschia claudopus]|uniref:MYND-type domain-containing protein n=1 Tax=Favolaschia claudopus TaxID=2862362 RepID=A0AAW0CAV3_9AGAR
MHSSLKLENIGRTSKNLRTLAMSLLDPHPSAQNVQRFSTMLRQSLGSDTVKALLPVLFRLLDPTRIPEAQEMDGLSDDILHNITLAQAAAIGLFFIQRGPQEAGRDLWPRVWAWAHFFFTYEDFLSGVIDLLPPRAFYCGFMLFCSNLCRSPDLKIMILSTDRAPVLAMRTWTTYTTMEDYLEQRLPFSMIHDFFMQGEHSFAEIMEGTSGGLSEVARLVMLICESAVSLPRTSKLVPRVQEMKYISFLCRALDIVRVIDEIHGQDELRFCRLCHTLIPLGFVEPIIIAGRQLSLLPQSKATPEIRSLVVNCILLIEALCQGLYGHRVLRTAVQHGLLHIIVAGATWTPLNEEVGNTLRRIIRDLLTPMTIFYHLLVDLRRAYGELKDVALDTFPEDYQIREAWSGFMAALQARLRHLDQYHAPGRIVQGLCANLECGRTVDKTDLRWCSGCHSVLYCGKECQIAHWRSGHRASCSESRDAARETSLALTKKEHKFIQCVSQRDSKSFNVMSYIAFHKVLAWAHTRANAVLGVRYDYSRFPVTLKLFDASSYAEAIGAGDAVNLEVSALNLRYGTSAETDIRFPLLQKDTRVPDALKRIAARLLVENFSSEQLQDEVERVLAECSVYQTSSADIDSVQLFPA